MELGQAWAKGTHVLWCAGAAVHSRCGSNIYIGRRQGGGLERAECGGPHHQTGKQMSQMRAAGSHMQPGMAGWAVFGICCVSGRKGREGRHWEGWRHGPPMNGVSVRWVVCWGLPLMRWGCRARGAASPSRPLPRAAWVPGGQGHVAPPGMWERGCALRRVCRARRPQVGSPPSVQQTAGDGPRA